MPVRDEDIAVGAYRHIAGAVEGIGSVTRDTGLSEPHQNLAFRTELENLLALAILALCIASPDISVAIDRQPVRLHEHSGAETLQKLARRIELEDCGIVPVKH